MCKTFARATCLQTSEDTGMGRKVWFVPRFACPPLRLPFFPRGKALGRADELRRGLFLFFSPCAARSALLMCELIASSGAWAMAGDVAQITTYTEDEGGAEYDTRRDAPTLDGVHTPPPSPAQAGSPRFLRAPPPCPGLCIAPPQDGHDDARQRRRDHEPPSPTAGPARCGRAGALPRTSTEAHERLPRGWMVRRRCGHTHAHTIAQLTARPS